MSTGFRPFAGRFAIECDLPPDEAKAAIRKTMVRWFQIKPEPRGWIVGPFLCLWLQPHVSESELILGYIRKSNWRTRVSGFTQSDILALAFVLANAGLIVSLAVKTWSGQLYPMGTLPLMLVLGCILFGFLWFPRNYTEGPLARHLRKVLTDEVVEAPPLVIPVFAEPARQMSLNIDGVEKIEPANAEDVAISVERIAAGQAGFAILEAADHSFIQCAEIFPGFVVEKGSAEGKFLYSARRAGVSDDAHLDRQDALTLLLCFLHGADPPEGIIWHQRAI